jgi:hypothetical protein
MKISSLVLGIGLGACAGPSHKEQPVMNKSSETTSDDQLVAQLREVIRTSVAPESIEATLGRKALINTTTGFPLEGLRRVNLVPDPEHPDETLSLETARAVVYWARSTPGDNPHVVGVQVRRDGVASVFFGIVYPP